MDIRLGSFRDLWASQCGSVITVQRGDRTIVWLLGEIDLTLEPDLALIALLAPRVSSEVVIDAAWMSFADCTVAGFIACLADQMEVTLRRPAVLLLDLLQVTGLLDRVKSDLSLSVPPLPPARRGRGRGADPAEGDSGGAGGLRGSGPDVLTHQG